MIHAGWFLRHSVDIAPEHMGQTALEHFRAIVDGGAIEYLDVRNGLAGVDATLFAIAAGNAVFGVQVFGF